MQFESHSAEKRAAGMTAPLFHAAWLFALGIAATHWLWLRPALVLAALALIAFVCDLAAMRAQRIVWLPMMLVWLLLGAWCALMEPQPAPAPDLAMLSDGLARTMEGTVVDAGSVRGEAEQNLETAGGAAEPSQRVDVRVQNLERVTDSEDAPVPVDGKVRLTVRWPADVQAQPFHCGERIRAVARLLPPAVYHDPGVWSRGDYLLDQGITSTGTLEIARVERLGAMGGLRALAVCHISGWQHATTARLMALPAAMRRMPPPMRLSQDDAVMLAAMVAGDRTFLTHTLRVGFERTGSFHMLVVSGFHLAIVAGCIFWITRRLRIPRVPATLVTIAASFAYALFTGFATPVQRSLWMVTLYLAGRLFYRERSALNTVGFAALCLLAASPRSLFESSLQMTLLAVVAIAGVAAPLLQATVHPYLTATRALRLHAMDAKLAPRQAQFRTLMRMVATHLEDVGLKRIGWRVFPWAVRFVLRLAELLAVACIVELAMTLPMAIYFHRITVFALPVNLLIMPLLTVLMPAALLTLLALVVWPSAAAGPAAVVALALHVGVWLVHLFGSLAYGDFRVATPTWWQSAAFWMLLALAIALARMGMTGGRGWPRRLAWAVLLLAAAAAVAPRPIDHPHNALLVEAIDVGQGDSLLIVTPAGKTLLVDAGGFGGGPHQAPQDYDIGEEIVSPVLWSRGIRHLDAVALSHAHSDHMGGMAAVLRNFHPDELWVGRNPNTEAYDALLATASELKVHVRPMKAGDEFSFGGTQVDVLAPLDSYVPGNEPSNNDSLVLHVAYGATSVLLEGDAEKPVEDALVAQAGSTGQQLESTLLKVGHHGSRTSTSAAFLARVAPQWAVISCGQRNRYGHPRQEILEELEAAHVRTLRTDIDGISCFSLDGKTAAETNCDGRTRP